MRLFAHSCPACEGLEGVSCEPVLGRRAMLGGGLALAAAPLASPALAQAVAGSTRRISLRRMQTGEGFSGIYWRDGHYDRSALQQLDWVMRDPGAQEATPMDPRLFDVLVAVQGRLNSDGTWEVVSGYRAPETNAARARQSRRVSTASLHMSGMAADCRLPDRNSLAVARAAADMQVGGVGLYRRDGFVHLDCGPSRRW
ncbi:MAG TPA: DUF882 domain-containing protein [Roseococcus sp.]|jgi:uncharacterized protein YcbK (DUF882 family)|nr:DUF882 domain-containing protein [Roseococcus sp.]